MNAAKIKWTIDTLRKEAQKYPDRTELRNGNYPAYRAANRAGVLHDLLPAKKVLTRGPRKWTLAAIKAEAKRYDSLKAFAVGSQTAYKAAKKHGALLDELFTRKHNAWPLNKLRTVASEFSSKTEFRKAHVGGYCAALKHGLINELFVSKHCYTTADVVYAWAAGGIEYDGKLLVKVGVTSSRLGVSRIERCAKANGLRPESVHIKRRQDAKRIEKSILSMGFSRPHSWGVSLADGRSEFRLMTPKEYQQVLQTINLDQIGWPKTTKCGLITTTS